MYIWSYSFTKFKLLTRKAVVKPPIEKHRKKENPTSLASWVRKARNNIKAFLLHSISKIEPRGAIKNHKKTLHGRFHDAHPQGTEKI
jgi:hypothetical protein